MWEVRGSPLQITGHRAAGWGGGQARKALVIWRAVMEGSGCQKGKGDCQPPQITAPDHCAGRIGRWAVEAGPAR